MNYTRLVLLNSSILTGFGTYRYEPISLSEARDLVLEFSSTTRTIQSAIGHQPTAELLANLLEFPVQTNRIEYRQAVDDIALVFKLRLRLPELKVLSKEEIDQIGYEFGLLTRLS